MNSIEFIKMQLEMSKSWVMGLAADMQDSPFTAPTPNGGNHPMWCTGHLVYSEANLFHTVVKGEKNPLEDWGPLFGKGSAPSDDASIYPAYADILAKHDEVRVAIMAYLDSITDADLSKETNAPEEMQAFFGTIGKVFAVMGVHMGFHGGQIADARRAAGRDILMA